MLILFQGGGIIYKYTTRFPITNFDISTKFSYI